MAGQIRQLLIETVFGLFIYVVLLRFWMQALRAPFRNPVGQFVIALSDWAVLPLRRIVPSFRDYDLVSFAVAWLAQIAMMVAALRGGRGRQGRRAGTGGARALARGSPAGEPASADVRGHRAGDHELGEPVQPALAGVRRADAAVLRFLPALHPADRAVDLSPLFVVVLAQVLLIVLDGMPRALLTSG